MLDGWAGALLFFRFCAVVVYLLFACLMFSVASLSYSHAVALEFWLFFCSPIVFGYTETVWMAGKPCADLVLFHCMLGMLFSVSQLLGPVSGVLALAVSPYCSLLSPLLDFPTDKRVFCRKCRVFAVTSSFLISAVPSLWFWFRVTSFHADTISVCHTVCLGEQGMCE